VKRALLLLSLAALLSPACGGTDRPEGLVERWLISLNQGKAGRPEKYAADPLSQRILPNWRTRDPGDLDVIEVGKGRPFDVEHALYDVPFQVKRASGTEISMIARLASFDAPPERVTELLPNYTGLRLPSQGGERIGDASAVVWLIGIGIAFALILLSVLLMSTVGREAKVSS
jgi:hypothetical protein